MTALCAALRRPSQTCLADPPACATQWITDTVACLNTGAAASNARGYQQIMNHMQADLQLAVDGINQHQPVRTAQDRRDYINWLASVCERKQREIELEFRYNVIFQAVAGEPPWAFYLSDWDEIETGLAAIPDEHLWNRTGGPDVLTFRRERAHPASAPGSQIGGETDPGTGLIRIFSAGMGASPYSRSTSIGLPATSQTLRHEVGHIVETIVPPAEMDRFFNDIVGWRQYSWAWITPHPSPYPNWAVEREQLCRDLGYVDAKGACDHARLTTFLNGLVAGTPVREGGRTYTRYTSFLVSWPVGNVPGGQVFEYARTGKGDYFAELYTLAISVPEFLHSELPLAQIEWFKQQVFHTQAHYDELIRPYERLAIHSSTANLVQVQQLLNRARQQFTRQQLQAVARDLDAALQLMAPSRTGVGIA
jgi:hypothetical protein